MTLNYTKGCGKVKEKERREFLSHFFPPFSIGLNCRATTSQTHSPALTCVHLRNFCVTKMKTIFPPLLLVFVFK